VYSERQLQSHRRDRLDYELADSVVDPGTFHTLTLGVSEIPAPAIAHIVGHPLAVFPVLVLNMHSAAAQTAEHSTLQQRRTFTGWAAFTIVSEGLSVLVQQFLDILMLIPRNIPGMIVFDESNPLALC
jgi:hypothetical protein